MSAVKVKTFVSSNKIRTNLKQILNFKLIIKYKITLKSLLEINKCNSNLKQKF